MTVRKFLATAAVAVVALFSAPATPAFAHAALLSTSPGQGATVPTAPGEVTLTFSEPVTPVPSKIRIIGPDGERADRGTPRADGAVLRIQLRDSAPIGTYLVSYRVVSADSHPVPGGFTFSVGAPSANPPIATNEATDPTVVTLIGVNRYLGYAGLVLLAGPAFVLLLLWPSRLSQRGPRRLLWSGFGLVGLSTVLALLLQAPYTAGTTLGGITGGDLSDVLGSTFGMVLLARLAILAAAVIVLRAALRRSSPARSDLAILGVLGAGGAGTWPLAGHPAATPVPAVTVVTDAVHLAAMAVWIGGLLMLGLFLLRPAKGNGTRTEPPGSGGAPPSEQPAPSERSRDGASARELDAILPVWSRWATLAVSAVLVTGVIAALIEVGSVSALIDTTYGRMLLVKLAVVAAVLAAAFGARSLAHRRDRDAGLRRAVLVEAFAAAAVIGVASVLVQTTPARVVQAEAAAPAEIGFNSAVNASLYSLQVQVEPATAGENTVHLYAYTLDGKPLKVVQWRVTTSLAAQGIEDLEVPMLPLTDNHASGSIALPAPGEWRFRFTLRTTEVDQETVTVSVPVR